MIRLQYYDLEYHNNNVNHKLQPIIPQCNCKLLDHL